MLALVRAEQGHAADARRLVTDAISLAERLGEPTILATTYDTAAAALARIGSTTEALTLWEQGLAHLGAAGPILACVYRSSYASGSTIPTRQPGFSASPSPSPRINSRLHQAQPLLPAATIAAATERQRIAHGFSPRSTTTGQGWRP